MSAVRLLQVMSMVRALRVMSRVVAMLMWVLQMVCPLVAPLVLSLRRVLLGVLWAVVSSVVLMARVTQAMHWAMSRPVCAVGDALGTVGGGHEGGVAVGATGDGGVGAAGDGSGDGVVGDADEVVCLPVCPRSRCWRWAVACACGGGGGGRCAGRLVGVVGCRCACWCVLGAGCGESVGGGCAVAVRLSVCVVWLSVAGVFFAWVVWGLVGVDGVGVGVWGSVLVVGVLSARCGRA